MDFTLARAGSGTTIDLTAKQLRVLIKDLDLSGYDSSGNYIGGSAAWDDPFEDVTFSPTVSGTYTFKIRRYASHDFSLNPRVGMYVNYYDQ